MHESNLNQLKCVWISAQHCIDWALLFWQQSHISGQVRQNQASRVSQVVLFELPVCFKMGLLCCFRFVFFCSFWLSFNALGCLCSCWWWCPLCWRETRSWSSATRWIWTVWWRRPLLTSRGIAATSRAQRNRWSWLPLNWHYHIFSISSIFV